MKHKENIINYEDCILSGKRFPGSFVTLEPISMSGLTDFHEYSILPGLYEHLEYPPFRTITESRTYLEKLIQRSLATDVQFWFICLSESGKIVGSIGLVGLDSRRSTVELGYGVSPNYWGRGVFSAACSVLMDYVFQDLGLHRVVAKTSAANTGSIKGLEKMRFHQEGILRDHYRSQSGCWFDALLLARLSTD
jgi:ribosomal-protein-alanine N-acetyltransferase